MLYIYMAIAFFFSNHLFCKLSEFKFFNIFDLYQFSTTCLGVCLLLLPVATSYKAVVVLSVMFGLMDGGRYGLMPLIVLTCVGQKSADQAWGFVAFSVGLSSAIGPVITGTLHLLQAFTQLAKLTLYPRPARARQGFAFGEVCKQQRHQSKVNFGRHYPRLN